MFIIRLHKGGTVNQSQARLQAHTYPIDRSEPAILLNLTISQNFPPAEHTSERPHCIEKISTSPGGFCSHVGTEKRQCRSHRSAVLSKIPLFCHLLYSLSLFTKMRTPHRMPRILPRCTPHDTANVHPKRKTIVIPRAFPSRAAAVHPGVLHVCETYTLAVLIIW